MKSTTPLLLAATAGLVASSQPHNHHHHLHHQAQAVKRSPNTVLDIINVPGPTIFIYELDGHQISNEEVEQGIKNGSLVLETGGSGYSSAAVAPSTVFSHYLSTLSESSTAIPSSTVTEIVDVSSVVPTTSTNPLVPTTTILSTSASTSSSTSSSTSTTSSSSTHRPPPPSPNPTHSPATTISALASSPSEVIAASNPNTIIQSSSTSSGIYADFPDGELDCTEFPSSYGAVSLDYLGLGGWAGIQVPGSTAGGYSDIMTMVSSLCTGADCCKEGAFCSYACPPGFQKSQWPTKQGATGQSVGGIQCSGGKLRLTNPGLSKSLCIPGAQEVSVMVQNKLGQNVAVCRTDYPGTEGETIPTNALPGQTLNLTMPSATAYYTWRGMSTSAQYYVNPAGIPQSSACTWGSPAHPWGNYAPLNLGVGYSNGMAWLSIFQNAPTTEEKLGFSVELVGDDGRHGNLNGRCRYKDGVYCSGDRYENCSPTTGCTISVKSGTATYVFS